MARNEFKAEDRSLEQNIQGGDMPVQQDSSWDPDRFPTSAKPVFRGTFLLVCLILGLCALVYYTSDHSNPEVDQRMEKARQEYLGEDGEL